MSDSAARRTVVLVVEDEPLQRMMAVDLVEEAGFEALEAADAGQAMELLGRRADIRIVFSDIDLPPGPDGVSLAALVREKRPPVGIILTSGKLRPRPDQIPARGVFLPKPYRERDLVAVLLRVSTAA